MIHKIIIHKVYTGELPQLLYTLIGQNNIFFRLVNRSPKQHSNADVFFFSFPFCQYEIQADPTDY